MNRRPRFSVLSFFIASSFCRIAKANRICSLSLIMSSTEIEKLVSLLSRNMPSPPAVLSVEFAAVAAVVAIIIGIFVMMSQTAKKSVAPVAVVDFVELPLIISEIEVSQQETIEGPVNGDLTEIAAVEIADDVTEVAKLSKTPSKGRASKETVAPSSPITARKSERLRKTPRRWD